MKTNKFNNTCVLPQVYSVESVFQEHSSNLEDINPSKHYRRTPLLSPKERKKSQRTREIFGLYSLLKEEIIEFYDKVSFPKGLSFLDELTKVTESLKINSNQHCEKVFIPQQKINSLIVEFKSLKGSCSSLYEKIFIRKPSSKIEIDFSLFTKPKEISKPEEISSHIEITNLCKFVSGSSGSRIPQVNLFGDLPKPKEFVPALLKVMGQLTNNTAGVWINYDLVLEPVMKLVGINPKCSPWPIRGKEPSSVVRNITYAYRNNKVGYRKNKPLFKRTEVSRVWALTEEGARRARLYNPRGSKKLPSLQKKKIHKHKDPEKVLHPIIPKDKNRSSKWMKKFQLENPNFHKELTYFASRKFSISHRIGLIEDHVNEFLCDLVAKDKVGRYYDSNNIWPKMGHIKGWMYNHIVSQIRKNGTEPVCMSLHGALSESKREALKKIRDGKESNHNLSWAESKGEVSSSKIKNEIVFGEEPDGETYSIKDFVGGDLEEEMNSTINYRQFVKRIVLLLKNNRRSDLLIEIFSEMSAGTPLEDIQESLGLSDKAFAFFHEKIKVTTALSAEECGLGHVLPDLV